MKNFILICLITFAFSFQSEAQTQPKTPPVVTVPTITETQATVPANVISDSTKTDALPETLWVVIDGDSVGIPTKDAEQAAAIVKEAIAKNRGNWPKTPLAWFMWVLAFAFSSAGVALTGNVRAIFNFLKVFLRKTLHVIAFIAGIFAASITLLLGKGDFDYQMFATLWGILSFAAVYAYETWIKKPDPEPEKK